LSILTKICVVLVLVVSVAASGAFLRIVSVQRSWKNAYYTQEDRAKVADLTSANDKIALQKEVAKLEIARGTARDLKKTLNDEQTSHTVDKAAAAQSAAVQLHNYDWLKASLTQLEQDLTASQTLTKQFSDEKVVLATAVKTSTDVARGIKRDFDEASVQILRLDKMAKAYALLIKDLRVENKELQLEIDKNPTIASKGAEITATPAPGQKVSGRVIAVHDGVASINIGRAKGIKEKMMLKVFRGGKYVCHLRIDLVQPDSSAGVILDKKLDVLQGDEVATDLK
jgi:hypothetical protein